MDMHPEIAGGQVEKNNRNVGGGNIRHRNQMLLVHGVGRATSIHDIKGMVITAQDGVPIKIQYRFRPREYGEQLVRMYLMTNNKESELVFVITPRIVRTMKPGEKPQLPSLEKYDDPDFRQVPVPGGNDEKKPANRGASIP